MFKKNKKQTETIKEPKEKKVRTVKVGTHKKAVIALWVVLIASVSFGVYKNFTAIDQHTTHEKEIIELRLQDTNGIENFVKNFAKSYYTWNNSKEAICKDGPDHEPYADPCPPGSVPAGKRTGASGGYHTGSGSEAGRAGRRKALPDRS